MKLVAVVPHRAVLSELVAFVAVVFAAARATAAAAAVAPVAAVPTAAAVSVVFSFIDAHSA